MTEIYNQVIAKVKDLDVHQHAISALDREHDDMIALLDEKIKEWMQYKDTNEKATVKIKKYKLKKLEAIQEYRRTRKELQHNLSIWANEFSKASCELFIDMYCKQPVNKDDKIKQTELYDYYCHFCLMNKLSPLNYNAFKTALIKNMCHVFKYNGFINVHIRCIYDKEEDDKEYAHIHRFIKKYCIKTTSREHIIKSSTLYDIYIKYCNDNNIINATNKIFSKILVDGYDFYKFKNSFIYICCKCTYLEH